jgi:hypothetical protein
MKVSIEEPGFDVENASTGGRVSVYDGTTCPEPVDLPQSTTLQGGETFETAVPISNSLPVSITGSFDTDNTRDYTCSCIRESGNEWGMGPDVVYSYTAASDDTVTFMLHSEVTAAALIIYDEDGNELECEWRSKYYLDHNTGRGVFSFPVAEGETYYLVVSCYYIGYCGDYTLSIISPDYTLINRSVEMVFFYASMVFDAVVGHEYLIEVSWKNPLTTTTVLHLEPMPDPPENDSCENATDGGVLEAGMAIEFTGDNTGATNTLPLLSSEGIPEVWVKFTLEDTLRVVRIDFCNNLTWMHGYITINSLMSYSCPWNSHDWLTGTDQGRMPNCPNSTFLPEFHYIAPGTYYYPMLAHNIFEGPYTVTFKGYAEQECDDESVFGQKPTFMNIWCVGVEFIFSDFEEGCAVVDQFEYEGDAIKKITWWGSSIDYDNSAYCDPTESYPFQIIFFDNNETFPYLPGDTVAVFDVSVTPEETGYMMNEFYGGEVNQKKFVAELPEALVLNKGWIMIRGDDGTNDCAFAWQNSDLGNSGLFYNAIEDNWYGTSCGMAFCLGAEQVGIDDGPSDLPLTFELIGNYPNPFNATTSIQFTLNAAQEATLSIYDVLGRKIKTLHSGILSAGSHSLTWNGTDQDNNPVASGIYFYNLDTSSGSYSKQMVLLK